MAITIERRERAVIVTMDRPPLNVLDIALLRELDEKVAASAALEDVHVVVLQGGGERAFSAGVDIRDHTREKVPQMLEVVHRVMRKIVSLPQVSVALVRGACLGGGCELASCCDIIVAAENSTFATPEIHVGCYPPVALARFAGLIGYHRAAEMILTGRRYSAQEAAAMGLVNRVFPRDQLDGGLESLLQELSGKSGKVLRVAVKGLRELGLRDFSAALQRAEEIYLSELMQTADVEEGVQAFLAKREPRWLHR